LAPPISFRGKFTRCGFDAVPKRLRTPETMQESGITASRHHRDCRVELSDMLFDVVGDGLPQHI
jgi:hypothetical protein